MRNPESPINDLETMEKPKILYHASPRRGIERLAPRQESTRLAGDGSVVFATPDNEFVTVFLIEHGDDSWVQKGKINGVPYAAINQSRDEFIKHDKGGAIYSLPNEEFTCNPEIGMGKDEWTCKNEVPPTAVVDAPSALDAMVSAGVQVYFLGDNDFRQLEEVNDVGKMIKILNSVESENQRRGVRVRSLADG